MQERTGPLIMTLSAKFLMDNDYSPDIKIKQVFLKYDESDQATREYIKIRKDKVIYKKVKDQFRIVLIHRPNLLGNPGKKFTDIVSVTMLNILNNKVKL